MSKPASSWWQDYFSPLYLEVYEGPLANPRETRREASFLEKALRPVRPGPILDIGCGFGRHVRAMRHRGFDVTGTDRFAHLLKRHPTRGRRAVCSDMRSLGFADGAFRGAYCIFNTFGYFSREENRAILAEIRRVLSSGGLFVLQIPNGPVMAEIAEEFEPSHTVGPKLTMTEEYAFDPAKNTLRGAGVWRIGKEQQEWSLELQLYSKAEIVAELDFSNLQVTAMYGDYEGEEFDADESSEIVLVARAV
ncbi:methyltransferase domain-containing protein [bacterium]|nr:methyltransferase domain-containing protein [bacterium]